MRSAVTLLTIKNNRADVLAGKALIVAYSRPIAMKIYYKILEYALNGKKKSVW